MKVDDKTGRKYGRLLVIKRAENPRYWKCLCDCGKVKNIASNALAGGHAKTCGCSHVKEKSGKRFGRLLVIEKSGRNRYGFIWKCRCDCGNFVHVRTISLTERGTKSCGCLISESSRKRSTTHGFFGTRTYKAWSAMLSRCNNPNVDAFKNYGARGIKVCSRWRKFENFLKDMGEVPNGLTLERKNNDIGYSPSNCEWTTMTNQANNRRSNVRIEIGDQCLTVAQWSSKVNVPRHTIYSRLKAGWSKHDAILGRSV